MKQGCKNGSPAFFAILVLFIVEIINISGTVPLPQKNNFEAMSNFTMFTVALAGFFVLGLPSRKNRCGDWGSFWGNIAVSAIAFLMNINVFEHTIQLEHLPENLWCVHMLWVICVIVQFLLLTGLGGWLLQLIKTLLTWEKKVIGWVENNCSDFADLVKNSDKRVVLTISIGFILWGVFLINQIRIRGKSAVFSDTDFWWNSIWMWLTIITISYLLHMVPLVFTKNIEAIKALNGKAVLAVTVFVLLAAAANVLPSLLQTIMIIISFPIVVMGILLIVIKKINNRDGQGFKDRNLKDVSIVLFCFVGLPLTIIFLATLLIGNNSENITQDPTNITAWLEFFKAAAETADSLLNLFI